MGRCTSYRVCRTHSILRTLAVRVRANLVGKPCRLLRSCAFRRRRSATSLYCRNCQINSPTISATALSSIHGRDSARALGIINERSGKDPQCHERSRLGLRRLNRCASGCRKRFGRQGRRICANRQRLARRESGTGNCSPAAAPRCDTPALKSSINRYDSSKVCDRSTRWVHCDLTAGRRETPAWCSTQGQSPNRLRFLRGFFSVPRALA